MDPLRLATLNKKIDSSGNHHAITLGSLNVEEITAAGHGSVSCKNVDGGGWGDTQKARVTNTLQETHEHGIRLERPITCGLVFAAIHGSGMQERSW